MRVSMRELRSGDWVHHKGQLLRVSEVRREYNQNQRIVYRVLLGDEWEGPFWSRKSWKLAKEGPSRSLTAEDLAALAVWFAPNARGGNMAGA